MHKLTHSNPPLYSGLGYQVPQQEYHQWIKDSLEKEEISTCIAFVVLEQKNTKICTGLWSSGIVACFNTHHKLFESMGDLQVGEQYRNMDFIVAAALKNCNIKCDIACQYQKNWPKQCVKLSDNL
ncbi:hypothetical protein ARMSODRAFT_1012838 [Armillaria solidipes]|uniref:Uncharacterized protein n=1 Tax=Armillaria solidipes TaxID=1076256 RepID=A0A2H3BWW0_9AGAR|nr:hypothetical protein ARMSODRAFT_1012838 [Armillaria solidipes]